MQDIKVRIIKNFEAAYAEYKKKKTGLIKEFFDQNGVTNVKKLSSHNHEGFGQRSGSKINGYVVVKYNNKKTFVGEFHQN